MIPRTGLVGLLMAAAVIWPGTAHAQPTRVELVQERGVLICGVSRQAPGFTFLEEGEVVGFDADLCRALAAWLEVDVDFNFLSSENRAPAVLAGAVDVVIRTAPETIAAGDVVEFGPVVFHDGQRLLVRAGSGIGGLDDLTGELICVQRGEAAEARLMEALRDRHIRAAVLAFEEPMQAFIALMAGRCAALSAESSRLGALRGLAPDPATLVVTGESLRNQALAPLYRAGDPEWARVVHWAVSGLILAEELGVTGADARDPGRLAATAAGDEALQSLIEAGNGAMLRVLARVGNYGEIYERWFGPGAATPIPREGTPNALTRDGGAMTSGRPR
jgi:general L-amino acid transport system substrate-binding protein